MPITGGLLYARPDNMYAGAPVEEVQALNQDASAQYSETRKAKDALDVLYENLDVREPDAHHKKRAIEQLRGKFSQLVQDGNYQDAEYLVRQATKEYLTDHDLQGAIANKKRETDYLTDLQKRFQEGKIDADDYQRAIYQSRQNNDKSISYNPDTMSYDNLYQGTQILDSKAKDIYDNTFKRIENWKEGTIIVNGQPYTRAYKDGRGYIVNEKGVEVPFQEVYRALETEIRNRPEFMDYINQKKDTDIWKRFTDPATGQRKPITQNDLIRDFDLSADEAKSIATYGKISKTSLESLLSPNKEDGTAKTKEEIAKDKELYAIQKAEYDKADISNLRPEEVQRLYEHLYVNDKVKDFVMPATEKASYQKFDETFREDKFALMEYKHKLDKELEKYKEKLANPVFHNIENTSVSETYQYSDLQDNFQDLYKTKTRIKEIEREYNTKDPNSMPKDIANEYVEAKANLTFMEASKSQTYEQMKNSGYDIVGKVKEKMFDKVEGNSHNETIFAEFLRSPEVLKALPTAKAYNEYRKAWEKLKSEGKKTSNLSLKDYTGYSNISDLASQVKKEVESNPKLSKYLEIYVDHAVDAYKGKLKQDIESNRHGYQLINYNPALYSYYEIGRTVEEEEERYFEDKSNKLLQLNTSILALDHGKDYDGETKNSDVVNKYTFQWNDVLRQGSDFKTMSGLTPQEFVDKYNEEWTTKSKTKKLTLEDLDGRIATKSINGKFAFVVPLPDGSSKIFFPDRQDEMARTLRDIGERYISMAGDEGTQKRGIEILSQVHFNNLKTVIPDAHLNNRKVGDIVPIDLPIDNGRISAETGRNQKFGLRVKEKLSNGQSIVQVVDQYGNPTAFDTLFGKIKKNNEFNSMDDLMFNLEILNLRGNSQ